MEKKPTREEMIVMAKKTRTQVTTATVSQELMQSYPAEVTKVTIPTRVGDSEGYLTVSPKVEEEKGIVINFHGGGFIKKRTENDELFCRTLSESLHCKVLDVDYRVAPEHPFPCGFQECYDVTLWVHDHAKELHFDAEKIILCGHSAGGNFVVGISMKLHEEGRFKPLAVISDYPPMDLKTDPAKKPSRGKAIPAERARLYNLYYCEEEEQENPYASPYYATEEMLRNFPDSLFITAGEDTLCTETEEFAMKVARAGNEVTLKRFEGAGHGFTMYRMEGYEQAVELIIRFAKNCGI